MPVQVGGPRWRLTAEIGRYGAYTFVHNGAIHPQDRLGEMLPPEWEQRLADSTDSERYFLHLMSRLARDGDMVAAIVDTTADISIGTRPTA